MVLEMFEALDHIIHAGLRMYVNNLVKYFLSSWICGIPLQVRSSGVSVEVMAWTSNYIPLSYTDMIYYPCPKLDVG